MNVCRNLAWAMPVATELRPESGSPELTSTCFTITSLQLTCVILELTMYPAPSLATQIRRARNFNETGFLTFEVDGETLGWLHPDFAEQLYRWPGYFQVQSRRVALNNALDSAQARTAALAECTRTLAGEKIITGWRNETYAIFSTTNKRPLFHIERAAMRRFGLIAHGVNLNAYVTDKKGLRIWTARRSMSKSIDPGLLDTLVGGGIASGYEPWGTLLKECNEEAGIPAELGRHVQPAGKIPSLHEVPGGLHREILHIYDLELPAEFTPVNNDNEVSEFHLLRPPDLLPLIGKSEFSVEAGLVTLDFLLRQSLVPCNHPEFNFLSNTLVRVKSDRNIHFDSLSRYGKETIRTP